MKSMAVILLTVALASLVGCSHFNKAEPVQREGAEGVLNHADRKSHTGSKKSIFASFGGPVHPLKVVVLKVDGMVCDGCAEGAIQLFEKQDEVVTVFVDLEAESVKLFMKRGKDLSDQQLKGLVAELKLTLVKIRRMSPTLK